MSKNLNLEKITSFCKRRGFIYPSSEIYGGLAGVYDYGHYGYLLKKNISESWIKNVVFNRDDVTLLDSAIFMHPLTWKASGHVDGFSDPQIDCKNCKNRMRADHILEKFDINADLWPIDDINAKLEELKKEGKIKCDKCGSTNLTEARSFNLLVKTNLTSPIGELQKLKDEDIVYARGETCQGIYLNYKNVIDTMRVKVPFGIAQIGKAFRNEIIARQFIFRTREFEQMEMQYFTSEEDNAEKYEEWKKQRWNWYINDLQIPEEKLNWKKHTKLVFYAKEAYDIEYNFECLGGFAEIEGIHRRGTWDLTQHSKHSKVNLNWFDQKTGKKFIPDILETSAGLNRILLAVIDNFYTEETLDNGSERVVLKLPFDLAPVKVAVFPLQKDEKLNTIARQIYIDLKKEFIAEFDDSGNIGKMYRRQDEIGTPYCITVDYDTEKDQSVTIRNRDTMEQERILISDLSKYIHAHRTESAKSTA